MYSGKDIHPFNTFSLNCTATKPSSIIPSLQLSWYHDEMELDNTVSRITILDEVRSATETFSMLTVSPARVFDSGMYTCSISVSIPESPDAMANQTSTVMIAGIATYTSKHSQSSFISSF